MIAQLCAVPMPTILAPASHRDHADVVACCASSLLLLETSPGLGSCGRSFRGSLSNQVLIRGLIYRAREQTDIGAYVKQVDVHDSKL